MASSSHSSPDLIADLRSLSELFSDPGRRTTGVDARDDSGRRVDPFAPEAVCFCLLGGAAKVAGATTDGDNDDGEWRYRNLCEALRSALPESARGSLAVFNDMSPHSQVVAVIASALSTALNSSG